VVRRLALRLCVLSEHRSDRDAGGDDERHACCSYCDHDLSSSSWSAEHTVQGSAFNSRVFLLRPGFEPFLRDDFLDRKAVSWQGGAWQLGCDVFVD